MSDDQFNTTLREKLEEIEIRISAIQANEKSAQAVQEVKLEQLKKKFGCDKK